MNDQLYAPHPVGKSGKGKIDMTADRGSLVAVATYRRNQELVELLDSLLKQEFDGKFCVAVVDNSENRHAESVVGQYGTCVSYIWEPKPGVVSARNRALQEINPTVHDTFAFVDDDETVRPDWLACSHDAMRSYAADVISGPVVAHLPATAPSWMMRGGFHQRKRHQSGAVVRSAATNNVLVSVDSWVAYGRPEFDATFNFTGGEDSEFFYRLRKAGAKMVWCDEAIVDENVPNDRLSAIWIWKRIFWGGNIAARLDLREANVWRIVLSALSRIAFGGVRTLASIVRGRGLQMEDVKFVPQGFGRLSALFGVRIDAYKR